ncbi:Serpin B3 [Bulinus truncatus]|nr:Serpin B3 [Bulinus truncatus]
MYYTIFVLAVIGHLVTGDLREQRTLSSVTEDFSHKLYQKIALDKSNIVYSPYSIHSSLSMTLLGARGETETEMKNTLGVTPLGDSVHRMYKELIQRLDSLRDVKVRTGNAIFVNPDYRIEPKFMQDISDKYLAKSDNIDLSAQGGPEKPINDYISDTTENTIKDILSPGTIDRYTVMLLVNAVFFNGTWDKSFDKQNTKEEDFKKLGGELKKVDMMHDDRTIRMKKDSVNGVDVGELTFKGGKFSMYISLPQKDDGIADLEKLLSQPDKVKELLSGLNPVGVKLAIPKFRTETTVTLNDALRDLGMEKAFDPMKADFTGITQSDKVAISQVLHKAVVEVQESGTVAAAATTVGMGFMSSRLPTTDTFTADHPFIYFLRDNETSQILFHGNELMRRAFFLF